MCGKSLTTPSAIALHITVNSSSMATLHSRITISRVSAALVALSNLHVVPNLLFNSQLSLYSGSCPCCANSIAANMVAFLVSLWEAVNVHYKSKPFVNVFSADSRKGMLLMSVEVVILVMYFSCELEFDYFQWYLVGWDFAFLGPEIRYTHFSELTTVEQWHKQQDGHKRDVSR